MIRMVRTAICTNSIDTWLGREHRRERVEVQSYTPHARAHALARVSTHTHTHAHTRAHHAHTRAHTHTRTHPRAHTTRARGCCSLRPNKKRCSLACSCDPSTHTRRSPHPLTTSPPTTTLSHPRWVQLKGDTAGAVIALKGVGVGIADNQLISELDWNILPGDTHTNTHTHTHTHTQLISELNWNILPGATHTPTRTHREEQVVMDQGDSTSATRT